VSRSKIKIGYRVEIRICPGLLRRSRGFNVWKAFECSGPSAMTACMSEKKALELYDKLGAVGFPKSFPSKPKWGRKGGAL
jgi:hypothetical protein